DLSATGFLFAIPRVRHAPVEAAQVIEQLQYIRRGKQQVIVIRKHYPGEGLVGLLSYGSQQCAGENVHALGAVPDHGPMFEAGGGDDITMRAGARAVRWRMPGVPSGHTCSQQLRALPWREFAPMVA